MRKVNGLTENEIKVWRAASELQRQRPQGSPSPSFDEIAELAAVSKMTVSHAISVLKMRKIAKYDSRIRRSLWIEKLFPKTKKARKVTT